MNKTNDKNQPLQTLKGFRDIFPEEKRERDYILNKILDVYQLFGFQPLETPTLEYASLLTGKYGDEADQLVYTFKDLGGREVGLRYDQTVPTARILAQYRYNLPKFFRRYQIQNVFRADKPQAGRYREFTQCDIDIFGTKSSLADAEILTCIWNVYQNIGFEDVRLEINDRQTLFSTLKPFTTDSLDVFSLIQSIDKLDKKTPAEVTKELTKKGLSSAQAKQALTSIEQASISDELKKIIDQAQQLGVAADDLVFNPTLARGLDYYTGMIFEVKVPAYSAGSCGAGGRYDKLIKQLGDVDMPAVGFGLGFDRTVEAAEELGLIPNLSQAAEVLVTIFGPQLTKESLSAANQLRRQKIKTQLYPQPTDNLGKQLKLANKKSIQWVIIIGDEEAKQDKVALKNMKSGDQTVLSLESAIEKIRTTQ